MARTQEIPKTQWVVYLSELSTRHRERSVILRLESGTIGDQVLAEGLPLLGISLEEKGPSADAIEITVAKNGSTSFCHLIDGPQRIYVQEGDDGRPQCMDIEDRQGQKTLLFFN